MTSSAELAVRRARKAAATVVERFGIAQAADIRLDDIAWLLGIRIEYGGLTGAAARLVRLGSSAVVRVNDSMALESRRRFSVAHEIGHHQLNHAGGQWRGCVDKDMDDYADRPLETQANAFAAELLMPRGLVLRDCEACPVELGPVRSLADKFSTSLTSAAIRFVELSPEMCAVVLSRDGKVEWAFRSDSMWGLVRRRGARLDQDSLAFDFFDAGKIRDDAEDVPADAWLEGVAAEQYEEIREHTLGMPTLGQALTVLWVPS